MQRRTLIKIKKQVVAASLCLLSITASAQDRKVWASGAARSIFQQNSIQTANDTVTPRQVVSGHALVDLAVNAKPNDQTFLHGMIRIRNDFGGFWGGGVTFDLRQLYVKGLIKNGIRYQLGDMNYKLTEYTFFSNDEELSGHQVEALNIYRDITRYDLFFNNDNTWRQQGAAVDFGFQFDSKILDELTFDLFSSRVAANFGAANDRVFLGGSSALKSKKGIWVGANYIDLMDLNGTSQSNVRFHNPVVTGSMGFLDTTRTIHVGINWESGVSRMYIINDPNASEMSDFFVDGKIQLYHPKSKIRSHFDYRNVGPQFRSVGAQSKRINYQGINQLFGRYQSAQIVRPITQMDLLQDVSLFQIDLTPQLDDYNPRYDNISPYGKATPNRKGWTVGVEGTAAKQLIEYSLNLDALSEVVGQGTEDLRQFRRLDAGVLVNLDTVLPKFNKPLEVSIGYQNASTTRTTEVSEGNIDLTTGILDLGLKVGVARDVNLMVNLRSINASGNELYNVRDNYSEVFDYTPLVTNLKEQLVLLAFQYKVNEKNSLSAIWQQLAWSDNKTTNQDFDMNQFAVVYKSIF